MGFSGGPTSAQRGLANSEMSFSNLLQSNYGQNFGAQSSILKNLTNTLTPIAEAGPDQQGFGANELAARSTAANEGVGRSFAKAKQSLNLTLGTAGGGNEYIPTGAREQLNASLATRGAEKLADTETELTKENYAQGRTNYENAVGGLERTAGIYNPTGYAGEATGANKSAADQQAEIAKEEGSGMQMLGGLVGGVGGAFLTGGMSNLGKGAGFFGGNA